MVTPARGINSSSATPANGVARYRGPTPRTGLPRVTTPPSGVAVVNAPITPPISPPAPGLSVGLEPLSTPTPTVDFQSGLAVFYYHELALLSDKAPKTLRKIFDSVAHSCGIIENDQRGLNRTNLFELGYNVEIRRPLADGTGRWAWSRYRQVGNEVGTEFSEPALPDEQRSVADRAVVQAKNNCLYGVDPAKPDDLIEIPFGERLSAEAALVLTGPGWKYFIKIASSHGAVALVQITRAPETQGESQTEALGKLEIVKRYLTHEVKSAFDRVRDSEVSNNQLWQTLAKYSRVKKMRFRDRLSGKKTRLEVMDLRKISGLDDPNAVQALAAVFKKISCAAWEGTIGRPVPGYSEEYIKEHFLADRTFLVRDPANGEFVAFCGANQISRPDGFSICILEVGMAEPRVQSMAIVTKLMRKIILEAFLANRMGELIVATRTANPQVLGSLQRLAEVYPDARHPEAAPSDWQKRAFLQVHQHLNPGYHGDESTFVVDGVYPMASGLVMPVHRVPEHRNPKVNELAARKLGYEHFNRPEFFAGELTRVEAAQWAELVRRVPEATGGQDREAALNLLIRDPALAGKLVALRSNAKRNTYIDELLAATETDRGQDFESLEEGPRETIKYLNRMLLEEIFLFLPKRRSKAMIIIGKVTAETKREDSLSRFKQWLGDMVIGVVRRTAK